MSTSEGDERQADFSLPYKNYVLSIVFLVMVFNIVDRTIAAILAQDIKRDLGLSDRELGVLLGPAFAILYALASLPIARLADRRSRRTIVSLGLVVWSAATALTAIVTNFWQILAARVTVGIGEAAGNAPNQSLISDYFPTGQRARALSVISVGSVVGLAVGQVAGGWMGEWFGWRTAFLCAGLPGIALALLMRFTVREPPRGFSEGRVQGMPAVSLMESLRYMFGLASFRWLLLGGALAMVGVMGRMMWEPTFLVRVHELNRGATGTWSFLVSGLPSALGIYLGAHLVDRLGQRDVRWYVRVPIIGVIVGAPLQAAFFLWPAQQVIALPFGEVVMPVAFFFSIGGSVFGALFTAPVIAVIQNLVKPNMRALAAATTAGFHSLIGHGVGPFVIGDLSQRLTPAYGSEAIRYALLLASFMMLSSVLACVMANRTLAADLKKTRDALLNEDVLNEGVDSTAALKVD